MKKKAISIVLILAALMALFTGCGKKQSSSKSALERVKKAGKIIAATDDTYPPMEYRDSNNKLIGFEVDMADALSKKLGIKIQMVPTSWDGIFAGLKAKKYDTIISCVTMTPEREKAMLFAGPTFNSGEAISVRKGDTRIKSADDLKGKTVGVQINTTGDDAVKKLGTVKNIKEYDKMTDAFNDLVIGRLDAVVVDLPVSKYYSQLGGSKFDVLSKTLNTEEVGIPFRLEDKDLRDAMNKAYKEIVADGTASKISMKWFNYDAYKK